MEKNKKKILIIEDEKLLLEMYQSRFEKEGYRVLTALSGKKGIALAQKEKPDLIILDILMPGIDGYEVIKKLKKDSRTRKIIILVFSNLGQPAEINRGLELEADDYIVKTDLTPSQLLNKVEKMVKK